MLEKDIKISTSKVNDPQEPTVGSTFDYDIPENLEEAQKRFPATMEDGKLVDPVYDLFYKGFVIAIQSPARAELVRQWEALPTAQRELLMERHESKSGEVTFTAALPDAQRAAVQAHMDAWVLGERAPRVRREYVADPVAALLEQSKTMTDDEKAAIAAQVAAILGITIPTGAAKRAPR